MQCVLTRDQGALEGTGAVVDIFQLLTRVVCRSCQGRTTAVTREDENGK